MEDSVLSPAWSVARRINRRQSCRTNRRRLLRTALAIAFCSSLAQQATAEPPQVDLKPRRLPAPRVAEARLEGIYATPTKPSGRGNTLTQEGTDGWSQPRPIATLASVPRPLPPRAPSDSFTAGAELNVASLDESQFIDWDILESQQLVGDVHQSQATIVGETSAGPSQPAPVWQVYINQPPMPTPPPVTIVNVPPGEIEREDPRLAERRRLAEIVSQQNRASSVETELGQLPPTTSESLTAVQLLRDSKRLHEEAERLLASGAEYAAYDAAVRSLRSMAAANDLEHGGDQATSSLNAALEAIREAGDFMGRFGEVDLATIDRMIASHRTPVLKGCNVSNLTPLVAADHYLDFARRQLTLAVHDQQDAANVLAVLGNAARNRQVNPVGLRDSIAICCLRAAVATNPDNAGVTSELGYHAMQLGLLDEARWALETSLASSPSRHALQNLIETHRLAGDIDQARALIAQLDALGGPEPVKQLQVTPVSPEEFAALSPPVQPGSPMAPTRPQFATSNEYTAHEEYTSQPAAYVNGATQPSVLDRMAGAIRGIMK